MDKVFVLKSKLIMPELSESFLLTDRLKRLHKNMNSCQALIVSAPAGYGKTTLALSYFHRQAGRPFKVCWYRLDPEDKKLPVFIAHLAEAVFPSEAAEFAESRKALEEQADMRLQPHYAVSVICREIWAHHSRSSDTRTYIVLDDFQNVAQVQDICDMIRYLLDNLPPSWAIFVLNRAHLHVFSEKQKLEKKVLEIGAEDLAFSPSEIEDLMLSMGQIVPDRKLTDLIARSTEGWVAGIIIFWQAFQSQGLDNAAIESGQSGHEDALFRYMSLEVLKSVPGAVHDDLARLALLQDFSEAEALNILGIGDVKSLIGQCIRFGVFIQRIPGNPEVYRFHALFREFLLSILIDRYPAEQIASLHLKAAGYYMRNANYGRAAEHLTKCGNSASAVDMVTKAGFNKFMIGETGQLKMWLDLLPEDIINDNPVLLLFKAQLMPNNRQIEIVDNLKKVLRLSLQDNNLQIYYDAASVLTYILMCSNDMKGLIEMTALLAQPMPDVSPELRNTLIIVDMVRSIGEEHFSLAEEQSESVLYALLPEDSKWLFLILSCIIYFCLGKLDQGERCMETALILDRFKNVEPSRGFILLFLSTVLILKNEKGSLPSNIAEIIAIGEKYDYDYLSAHGRRLAALERYLSFDGEAAVALLDQAVFHFRQINNKAMAAACRLLRCLWSIQPNRPGPHLDEARKDIELIQKARPGMMVYEGSLSIFGAIAREVGDFQMAERCLLESIKAAQAKKSDQVLCGSFFHLARLYYTSGDTERGYRYLKQAMDLAAGNRYRMFWDIHIPTVLEIALRSILYGYACEYAEELLDKFYSGETVRYLIARVKTIDESRLAAFVDDFVFTYKEDGSKPLYLVEATLFGKPDISINGIKIPDSEWKTKKVKGFLDYLLLASGTTVPKEILAEIFWSGSDRKSAIASQRTALYYLRKTLSQYHAEVTGNNAFIYETPEGLQIRKNEALELDMHKFLRLYDELSLLAASPSEIENRQVDMLERMISIYKGDLMEGSDYADLIFQERERLKSIFIEACQKLSAIYTKRGEWRQAEEILKRTLAAEPYNENVCLELLELYMAQGQRSKAVKLYHSFKKRLEQELDIKIDRRLTEAVKGKA